MGCVLERKSDSNNCDDALARQPEAFEGEDIGQRCNTSFRSHTSFRSQSESSVGTQVVGSVGISDLELPIISCSHANSFTSKATSMATSLATSFATSFRRSRPFVLRRSSCADDQSRRSAGSWCRGETTLSSTSCSVNQREMGVFSSWFQSKPTNARANANERKVFMNGKRLQACQGVRERVKEKEDERIYMNDEFQMRKKGGLISSLRARRNSTGNIVTSLGSDADVAVVDKSNSCRAFVSIPRSSLNSMEYDGTFMKYDIADDDSEYISNGMQSFNRVTIASAKPTFMSSVDDCESHWNNPSMISPKNASDSDRLIERGSIGARTFELYQTRSTIDQDSECEYSTFESLRADESDCVTLGAGNDGTSHMMIQRKNAAANVAHSSSLDSEQSVENNDTKANPQKVSAKNKLIVRKPNSNNSSRRFMKGAQKMRRASNDLASLTSSQRTVWSTLESNDSLRPSERLIRLFGNGDGTPSNRSLWFDDDGASSSEMFSQFGDLMDDTSCGGKAHHGLGGSSRSYKSATSTNSENDDGGGTGGTTSRGRDADALPGPTNVISVNLVLQLNNESEKPHDKIMRGSFCSSLENGGIMPRRTLPLRLSTTASSDKTDKLNCSSDQGVPTKTPLSGLRISASMNQNYEHIPGGFAGLKQQCANVREMLNSSNDNSIESLSTAHKKLRMAVHGITEEVLSHPQIRSEYRPFGDSSHYSQKPDVICAHKLDCDTTPNTESAREEFYAHYNCDFGPGAIGVARYGQLRSVVLLSVVEDEELDMDEAERFEENAARMTAEGPGCVGNMWRGDAYDIGIKQRFSN